MVGHYHVVGYDRNIYIDFLSLYLVFMRGNRDKNWFDQLQIPLQVGGGQSSGRDRVKHNIQGTRKLSMGKKPRQNKRSKLKT